jgi:hypothetical protein
MRRVRSQFLGPVFRLGFAVRGRGVSGGAVVAPSVGGTGASSVGRVLRRGLAVAALAFAVVPVGQASAEVTVSLAGSGTGTVTSNPVGIGCSNTPGDPQTACSFEFNTFTLPSFTAVADPPFVFREWSGANGGTCSSGTANPCSFAWGFGGTFTLTATFVPAPDAPVAVTDPATDVTSFYGATLHGKVNPSDFPVGECRFEYGTSDDYGETTPCDQSNISGGTSDVSVSADIGYLEPDTTYHYQLAAENPGGTGHGEDRTFTTGPAPADDCPNAGIRAEQGAGARLLPDCMAYEWVSNSDSWGLGLTLTKPAIADSGNRAQFTAQAFGQPDSLPGYQTRHTAERGEEGWIVSSVFPDPEKASGAFGVSAGLAPMSRPDLGRTLWPLASPFERQRAEVGWGFIDIDGTPTPASDHLVPIAHTSIPTLTSDYSLLGASFDLSTFAFRYSGAGLGKSVKFFSDEFLFGSTAVEGTSNLYAISGADGPDRVLSVVNRETDPSPGVPGALIGGGCGAGLGSILLRTQNGNAYRAVSADGAVMYFSAGPGTPETVNCGSTNVRPKRVFKRVGGTTTVAVSESQCVRVAPACAGTGNDVYQSASLDGSVVFFSSPRQLTDSDLDTTNDLYVYDASPPAGQPKLVQASAGEVVTGHPTLGSGANVVSSALLDSAADGSRVYFAATGVLTGANTRGASPVAGQPNVYVFERNDAHPAGRIAFVATLPDPSVGEPPYFALPVEGESGDGHFLVFSTVAALVAEDGDTAHDVYRYDDTNGELVCASCDGDANIPTTVVGSRRDDGAPNAAQQSRVASGDVSSIVFTTEERLSDADRNSTRDVYMWRDGDVSLVSGGTGQIGIAEVTAVGETLGATGISPDGENVFFFTRASLYPTDGNRQADLYVARVDGGFPEPAEPAGCDVVGDGCQGGGSDSVGSARETGSGGGNAVVGQRVVLALQRPGRAARVRAGLSGVLAVGVRASQPGAVRLLARARVGGKVRRVGSSEAALSKAGRAVLRLRLSRVARRQLQSGRSLTVRLEARLPGARARAMSVRLPGDRS